MGSILLSMTTVIGHPLPSYPNDRDLRPTGSGTAQLLVIARVICRSGRRSRRFKSCHPDH